jgi:surface polysaccharide O-acyltransferase-like enzyme
VLHAFLADGGRRRAMVLAASTLGFTLVVFMIPGVLALGNIQRPIQLAALTFWLAYVGYFLVGYAVSTLTIMRKWLIVAAVGIFVFGTVTILQSVYPDRFRLLSAASPVEYLGTIVALLSICVLVLGVNLLGRIPLGPRLSRMVVTVSEASFGVFLVHFVVLLAPYEILPGFHEHRSLAEALLTYVIVLVASFAISIGARKVPLLRAVF